MTPLRLWATMRTLGLLGREKQQYHRMPRTTMAPAAPPAIVATSGVDPVLLRRSVGGDGVVVLVGRTCGVQSSHCLHMHSASAAADKASIRRCMGAKGNNLPLHQRKEPGEAGRGGQERRDCGVGEARLGIVCAACNVVPGVVGCTVPINLRRHTGVICLALECKGRAKQCLLTSCFISCSSRRRP